MGDGDSAETIQANLLSVESEDDVSLSWLRTTTIDVQLTGTDGDISLTEVAAGGAVTAKRIAQTNAAGSGSISLTAAGGSITVATAANGGSGITTLGSGTISVTAQGVGSDLTVGQVITSTTGTITVTAADEIVTNAVVSGSGATIIGLNAASVDQNANISSVGGPITVIASTGAIDMQSGTTTSSVSGTDSGQITLSARTNVLASVLDSDGAIGITATSGFISDNLAAETANLKGGTTAVTMTAATGIGASNDHLDTTIATLTATLTGVGGMYVTEDDGVTVTTDGITANGSSGTVVVVSETGALTISGSVAFGATATGRIRLEAAAGNVSVGAAVDAGEGNLSVLATGGDIRQQAGGVLATAGSGTIDVEAAQAGAGGNVTITDGVTSTTAGGDIRYRATNALTITGLNADTGNVGLTSTAGSVADAGDTNLDVQAGGLRLWASNGVGTGANHLDISVASLSGTAGAGGLFLTETNAVTVASVTITVQRTTATGALDVTTDAAQSDLTTTANGAVVLVAGDAVTVTDGADGDALGVSAAGSGNVLIRSTATTVAIQSGLDAGSGHVTLRANTAYTQTATGDIVTSGTGTIDVEAGTSLTMSDGATTITGGGNIRYASVNDLTVTGLNAATGSASVYSSAGSILDAGETAIDVVASAVRLQANAAGKGIGLSANHLDINADSVTALADSAGLFLTEASSVTVTQVAAISVNRIGTDATIESTPTDAAQSDLVTANGGAIVLEAAGALTLEEGADTADDLGVGAPGAGNVLLRSTGSSVTLNGKIDAGSGHVTVRAATSITQSGIADIVTSGTGTIDVEAGTSLTMADGAYARTANQDIRYQALTGDLTVEQLDAGTAFVKLLAGGSVLDEEAAGDTAVDVTASGLYVEGGTAIGAWTNFIEVDVATLALSVGAGGAFITESDDLTVTQVDVTVQQVGSNAAVTAQAGSWTDLNSTAGGRIAVVAGGSMTLTEGTDTADDRAVHAQGGGQVLLDAGTWFLQQAHIVAEGGSVETRALGGTSVMEPGTYTTSSGGDIHYLASEDLRLGVLDARQTGGTSGKLQVVSTGNATIRDSDDDRTINLYGTSLNFVGKGPRFDVQGYQAGRSNYPVTYNEALESAIDQLYFSTTDHRPVGWLRGFQHMPATYGLLEDHRRIYLQVVDQNGISGIVAPAPLNTVYAAGTFTNLWVNGYFSNTTWYQAVELEHRDTYTRRNLTAAMVLSATMALPDAGFAHGGRAIVVEARTSAATQGALAESGFGLDGLDDSALPLLDLHRSSGMVDTVGTGSGGWSAGTVGRPFEYWIENIVL